ncbi:hypothetical protein [Vibrio phage vB_ValS_PJ32]|nr:hypothetical protein [Vibrio phage vB_ValS_PJ32]
MNPNTKARYFNYGLLDPSSPYHHEILNNLNWYIETGVQPEYIYQKRLTDFLPVEAGVCGVAKNIRKFKSRCRGVFFNQPYETKTGDIAQAFAGTMIRNEIPTRVMQLQEALIQLKERGLYASPVYVLTYPTRYNGNVTNYNSASLFDLFIWAERKNVFLVLINDSSLTDTLSLNYEEDNYIKSRFAQIEGVEEWQSH